MPIRAEMRWFYPIDWPQISRHVRFERAGGSCQGCGRPHGETVRCLPDGRWYDTTRQTWRNGLQKVAGDGTSLVNVGGSTNFATTGVATVDLPPGLYQFTVSLATAVYAEVARVPGD
jgi:hypothetical protein